MSLTANLKLGTDDLIPVTLLGTKVDADLYAILQKGNPATDFYVAKIALNTIEVGGEEQEEFAIEYMSRIYNSCPCDSTSFFLSSGYIGMGVVGTVSGSEVYQMVIVPTATGVPEETLEIAPDFQHTERAFYYGAVSILFLHDGSGNFRRIQMKNDGTIEHVHDFQITAGSSFELIGIGGRGKEAIGNQRLRYLFRFWKGRQ